VTADALAKDTHHVHEAGFYGSDAEFRSLITPFAEEGLEAGEPLIFGYDERKNKLVSTWLPASARATFISDTSLYATPARAIATFRRLFARHVADGAPRIRVAGDVPHEGNGRRFQGWDRYEAAVNTAWSDYPVRSLCLYDANTVSSRVRDVVERTHPCLLTAAGERLESARYEDPFVPLEAVTDALEHAAPLVTRTDISPAEARTIIEGVAAPRLDGDIVHDLILAVSEAVSNALVHGRPPVRFRLWADPGQVIVHVHDSGHGPRSNLPGLMPVSSETGAGLGLWLIHQLDLDVDLIKAPDGFTVRLCARRETSVPSAPTR
jgi:anti-sigma regulatory factor (Ser/Thr protein kinase)